MDREIDVGDDNNTSAKEALSYKKTKQKKNNDWSQPQDEK